MWDFKNIQWKPLLLALAAPLGVGAAAALLTQGGMAAFRDMSQQPPLSPPAWVFPVVWTVLYTLMGIASYLVYIRGGAQAGPALGAYAMQLAVNFAWPLLFFGVGAYLAAAVWLAALLALAAVTAVRFYRVDPTAGWLLAPYLIWLVFAEYLNIGVYLLNR